MDRTFLKCDHKRYSTSEISTKNTYESKNYINKPREDFAISLTNCYLDLNFDIVQAANGNRYADNNDTILVNSGPIALTSKYYSTTISGKQFEENSHAHIVS